MTRVIVLSAIAACLAFASPAAAAVEEMFSIINRYGDAAHGTDWELGVLPGSDPTSNPLPGTQTNFDWSSMKKGGSFTLKYDPKTGVLSYTVGGATLSTTLLPPQSADSFSLDINAFARQHGLESSHLSITDLAVNGQPISDTLMVHTHGSQVHSIALDNLPKDGFTITGHLAMDTSHQVATTTTTVHHPGHSHPPGHAYGHHGTTTTQISSLGSSLGVEFTLNANTLPSPPHGGGGGGLGAVPEPGTLALMGGGLAGAALWRRWGRRWGRRKS